jgi:type II secretory ATPase GspE/PulE/Tfp pilus assembly ATPase PilB-like protein
VVALDQIRALAREELRIEQVLRARVRHHHRNRAPLRLRALDRRDPERDRDRRRSTTSRSPPTSTSTASRWCALVDALLNDAVKRGASDIHFEPEQGFLRIRYRVDGVLRQIRSLHKNYWAAMVVRLKVMSGMNIAETRRAAGRAHLAHPLGPPGRLPRVRAADHATARTSCCACSTATRASCRSRTWGCTRGPEDAEAHAGAPRGDHPRYGPDGSGKTTTLYSILNFINTEGINIMTLEDPVEYRWR